MKIIINVFYDEKLIEIPERVIRFLKAEECYYIYDKKIPRVNKTKLHLLKRDDVYWKADYQVDLNSLIPLDETIIKKMAGCETVVLKMMDRYEFGGALSHSERKRIYLKHLRFWNHVFETEKINLFLASNIPHEVYDFIIYSLCKLKGISTLFLYHQTQIKDCALLLNDYEDFCPELKAEYKKLLKEYSAKKNREIVLDKRFEEEYEAQLSKINKTPFWINMQKDFHKKTIFGYISNLLNKIKTSPFIFLKSVLKPFYWKKRISVIFENKNFNNLENKLFSFYGKHSARPNLSEKYIYFPLQYQPELSTSPLAGPYVDQLLIVQMISVFLPKNVKIYIKEHPMQRLIGRDINFYKDAINVNNVKLIDRNYDSFVLIDNCIAVVTSTGTPGWEAIFRNKPVLMFGDYFYEYAPGVYRIKNVNDCEKAISSILKNKKTSGKIHLEKLRIFLKAYENISIRGFIDPFYKEASLLSYEENIDNISTKLFNRLKLIF